MYAPPTRVGRVETAYRPDAATRPRAHKEEPRLARRITPDNGALFANHVGCLPPGAAAGTRIDAAGGIGAAPAKEKTVAGKKGGR